MPRNLRRGRPRRDRWPPCSEPFSGVLLGSGLGGCAGESARVNPDGDGLPLLVYAGSSTVANFMREAEPVYARARFLLRTEPESLGGERMIQTGEVELAGVAREPTEETLDLDIHATFLATDALAVVVNTENPVSQLTPRGAEAGLHGEGPPTGRSSAETTSRSSR